jgi:hypothetical protein
MVHALPVQEAQIINAYCVRHHSVLKVHHYVPVTVEQVNTPTMKLNVFNAMNLVQNAYLVAFVTHALQIKFLIMVNV